jgi:hypothetical protein
MNQLSDLLTRQVAYVQRQPAERFLLATPRLVAFIQNEPRLRAIADDIAADYSDGLEAFRKEDARLTESLRKLWRAHSSWFTAAWNAEVQASQARCVGGLIRRSTQHAVEASRSRRKAQAPAV